MRHFFSLLISASIVLLLTGCHFLLEQELYNNSGQDLAVVSIDAATNSRSFMIRSGQSARIGFPFKLRVQGANGTWNYDLLRIPLAFHKKIGINTHLVKTQLQKDGLIYLLSPNSTDSNRDVPRQPDGFPIRPKP